MESIKASHAVSLPLALPRRSGRRAPRRHPLGASTTRPGRRSWPELCAPPSAHRSLWGLSPPSCHSTGERQRPRGATGSQGTGRACSARFASFAFLQATFHKGTREILLNPAFSVQNSLVRVSGSLRLYLAQVNPAGTEFTRPSYTVLKRKPLVQNQFQEERKGPCQNQFQWLPAEEMRSEMRSELIRITLERGGVLIHFFPKRQKN